MWMSLSKLAGLPDDTLVYCGHEYTLVRSMYFFQNHISGEFSCMASQMYKVAFQTNVFEGTGDKAYKWDERYQKRILCHPPKVNVITQP